MTMYCNWVHDWSMYKLIRSRFSNCFLDKLALLRFPDLSFSYHLVTWCDRLSCTSNWLDIMSLSMDHEYRVILLYPVLEVGSLHLYSAFGLTAFTVRVIWAWDRVVLAGGPLELNWLIQICSWEIWRILACKEVCKSFPELIKYYILIDRARI